MNWQLHSKHLCSSRNKKLTMICQRAQLSPGIYLHKHTDGDGLTLRQEALSSARFSFKRETSAL